MANYTYTTNWLESPLDYRGVNDWWSSKRNPETIFRRKCIGIGATFASPYFTKTVPWANKFLAFNKRNATTLPQFSGQVDPAGIREVSLCQYQDNDPAKLVNVLETMGVDVSGNFQCAGWYKPRANGVYFFRVTGDSNYSTKDFPLQPPIENEKRFGYMVNQDTYSCCKFRAVS